MFTDETKWSILAQSWSVTMEKEAWGGERDNVYWYTSRKKTPQRLTLVQTFINATTNELTHERWCSLELVSPHTEEVPHKSNCGHYSQTRYHSPILSKVCIRHMDRVSDYWHGWQSVNRWSQEAKSPTHCRPPLCSPVFEMLHWNGRFLRRKHSVCLSISIKVSVYELLLSHTNAENTDTQQGTTHYRNDPIEHD